MRKNKTEQYTVWGKGGDWNICVSWGGETGRSTRLDFVDT